MASRVWFCHRLGRTSALGQCQTERLRPADRSLVEKIETEIVGHQKAQCQWKHGERCSFGTSVLKSRFRDVGHVLEDWPLSGGNTDPDPYYSKDPPKQTKQRNLQSSKKSYKDAVKPKRITRLPNGKRRYYYDCENCRKEFGSRVRKHNKHAFCGRDCFDKWQKHGIKHPKRNAEQRKQMAKRTRDSWKNPEIRKRRMKDLKRRFRKKNVKMDSNCPLCGVEVPTPIK